jgi:predicted MarR family transcription regulator
MPFAGTGRVSTKNSALARLLRVLSRLYQPAARAATSL